MSLAKSRRYVPNSFPNMRMEEGRWNEFANLVEANLAAVL